MGTDLRNSEDKCAEDKFTSAEDKFTFTEDKFAVGTWNAILDKKKKTFAMVKKYFKLTFPP